MIDKGKWGGCRHAYRSLPPVVIAIRRADTWSMSARSRSCAKNGSPGTGSRVSSILTRPAAAAIAGPAGGGAMPMACRGTAATPMVRPQCPQRDAAGAVAPSRVPGGGSMPLPSSTQTPYAVRRAAAVCTRTSPSDGATGFSPFRRASSRPVCTASWKQTKPTSWNPSRGSAT
jgi:hypothetical protein